MKNCDQKFYFLIQGGIFFQSPKFIRKECLNFNVQQILMVQCTTNFNDNVNEDNELFFNVMYYML